MRGTVQRRGSGRRALKQRIQENHKLSGASVRQQVPSTQKWRVCVWGGGQAWVNLSSPEKQAVIGTHHQNHSGCVARQPDTRNITQIGWSRKACGVQTSRSCAFPFCTCSFLWISIGPHGTTATRLGRLLAPIFNAVKTLVLRYTQDQGFSHMLGGVRLFDARVKILMCRHQSQT